MASSLQDALTWAWTASSQLTDLMSTKDHLIPVMEWEGRAADALDVARPQLRFIIALFAAVPISWAVRWIRSPSLRKLYSICSGLLLLLYPFGQGVYQVIFPTVVTYLAMLLFPRRCAAIVWATVFTYLVWLQVVTASGMAWNEGEIDFVGAIMILTLKLIAMAACYQDSFVKNKDRLTPYQQSHLITRMPSPLSYLSFVFGLGNLLAGPPIEYSEFNDFIELKGLWDPKSPKGGAPMDLAHGGLWVVQGIGFMALHILLISKLGWGVTGNYWFQREPYISLPLWQRLGCQVVCGFAHQIKYYFLWKLAESANVFSGFDFVGWSPEGKAAWGRCTNVRFLGMWLSDSARVVPSHWNIRTGIFLKNYVYERLAGPGGKAGFVHVLMTQLVTALWHGVYPGYFIFFVGTVFYLQSASTIYRAERLLLPERLHSFLPWWLLKVFWTDLAVTYMAMAFVLLDGKVSIEVHRDVYFLPHIIMVVLTLLGLFLPSSRSRTSGAAKAAKKTQ